MYDPTGTFVAATTTDGAGAYSFSALPAGTYFARTFADLGHQDQLFTGIACAPLCPVTSGTPILVTSSGATLTVDFSLPVAVQQISGHVVDSTLATPLANVTVWARDAAGSFVASALTAADGSYAIVPRNPGTYYLSTINDQGYLDELYDNHFCGISCAITGGTPVIVTAGVPTVVDFALDKGASITGTITDGLTSLPVPDIFVFVYDSGGRFVAQGRTGPTGGYSTTGLPSGTYFVRTDNRHGYIDQLYNGTGCVGGTCIATFGTPIALSGTSTQGGIDFLIFQGGVITGTITRPDNGAPVAGVVVTIFDSSGTTLTASVSDETGVYTSTGLPAGNYFARTSNQLGLKDQLYSAVACAASQCSVTTGTQIPVALQTTTGHVDFALAPGAELTGLVTDAATGATIAGVQIGIYNASGTQISTSTTDATGRFRSTGLVGGTYLARTVNAPGHTDQIFDGHPCSGPSCIVLTGTPIAVTEPSERAGINFALGTGGTISGRVTNTQTGNPIAGVDVEAYTPGPGGSQQFAGSTLTDASGNYEIHGLPDGTYFVFTVTNGVYADVLFNNISCPNRCFPGSGTPLSISGSSTISNVNFALAPAGQITGQVTAATGGGPLPGILLQVYKSVGTTVQLLTTVTTNSSGQYSASGLPAGSYFVVANGGASFVSQIYNGINCSLCVPGPAPGGSGTPIGVAAGVVTPGINFALSTGGQITGRVFDAVTNAPLPSAFVTIYTATGGVVTSAATNSLGQYTVGGIAPGTYRAVTSANGYSNQVYSGMSCATTCAFGQIVSGTPIIVSPSATTNGIDFPLTRPSGIAGRVTSAATNAPVLGVLLQIFSAPSGAFVTTGFTDASGNYSVTSLAPGSYFVRTTSPPSSGLIDQLYNGISCQNGCLTTSGNPVVVASGAITGIDFHLATAPRITGHVSQAANNASLSGISISVFNDQGTFVSSGVTDPSGNYSSSALTPGTFFVRTTNANGFLDQLYSGISCATSCVPSAGTPVTVLAGQVTGGINFALQPSGRIVGNVRTSGGAPLNNLEVDVFDSTGFLLMRSFTDSSGNYTSSTNLTSGNYFVKTTNARGFIDEVFDNEPCLTCDPTTGTPVAVTQGTITPGINFALDTGGAIAGRVTAAPAGTPLSNASVQIFDSAGTLVTTVNTDGSGNYATKVGLSTGQYYARTMNNQGFRDVEYATVDCVYDGCPATSGSPIGVNAGQTAGGINFALTDLGRITGTVLDAVTGLPVISANVRVYNASSILMASSFTVAGGAFTIRGLAPGAYYAVANRAGYKQQVFDHVTYVCADTCVFTSGTPIVVSDGNTVGIMFNLSPGGRIAGHITDANTHAALSSIAAEIYDGTNVMVARAATDGSGNYTSDAGLPSGTYYLRTRNGRGYVDQLFSGVPCMSCSVLAGAPIAVVDGSTTSGVDLQMTAGARLSGTILVNGHAASPGFANLQNIDGAFVTTAPTDGSGNYVTTTLTTVNVYDSAGAFVTNSPTDGSGNYATAAGLPDGTYYAVTANGGGFLNEAFNNVPCPLGCSLAGATPITVSGGHNVSGVNFDLGRGGRIAGTIRDAATGVPLRSVWVDVYDAEDNWVATAYSTSNGTYATNQGLPSGTYFARTRDFPGYRSELYKELVCAPSSCATSGGTPIVVTSPSTTAGIDFTLTAGPPLQPSVITWANPADISYPTALDATQLNATANVPGTFVYSPAAGIVLAPGNGQILSVTFTPTDTNSYLPATATVTINVLQAPLAVTVVAPNGGEKLFVGVPYTVQWTSTGGDGGHASSFDVAFSTDAGVTFTDIAGCVGLGGTLTACAWTPAAAAAPAIVRVTAHDSGGATTADVSDASFRIAAGPPSATVKAPNTAVEWGIGTTVTIKWTDNFGAGSPVKIEVSRDGGTSWETIAASIADAVTGTNTYDWVVTGPATAAALVRVSGVETPATDVSDVPFTIAAPSLTVTAPNTAVTWRSGTAHNVTFSHNLGIGAAVDLDLSRDGGATWTPIGTVTTTNATTGKLAWTVTGPQTTQALVRATWHGHPASDVSDVTFTISPRINLTLPKTAVVWAAGSQRQVTWTDNLAPTDTVDIDFSTDGGATWSHLALGVPKTSATGGTWAGAMPTTLTTQAVIRVTQTGAPDEWDTTAVPFTIAEPALSITAPITNVNWTIGLSKTIKWSHNLGTLESVSIELSRDGGSSWEVLAPSIVNNATTVGTFDWTVTGPATASAVVRVKWLSGNSVSAVSPVVFRIQ